jgi:hypothetical protein
MNDKLAADALAAIRKQHAEIERLKAEIASLRSGVAKAATPPVAEASIAGAISDALAATPRGRDFGQQMLAAVSNQAPVEKKNVTSPINELAARARRMVQS